MILAACLRLARTRPTSRLLLAAVAVPVAAATMLTACGGSEPGSSEGDGGGGSLVVYSGRNENLISPLVEKFRASTGIDAEVRYGGSAELAAQMLEEGDRSPADVFLSQDAGALGAVGKGGLLTTLPDATSSKVPERYRAADGSWVGVSGRARVIAYNPREVADSELPGSVFDLTDPTWRDQVGIAPTNASFQAFVTAMRVLEGDEATRTWLEDMVGNGAKFYPNNVAILDAVDRGEINLGLINHYYWFERVDEVGRDAVSARLHFLGGGDPGALVNTSGVGIVAGTDQPDNAQRFVDYLLSTEAQTYFAQETFEYPVIDGVPTAEGLVPIDELSGPPLDLSQLDDLAGTLTMLQEAGLT